MPVPFESHLAPEDREAYETYGNSDYRLGAESEPPMAREAFEANLYGYHSTSPNKASALAAAFLQNEGSRVNTRQYGNTTDQAYRLPDGSQNKTLLQQDIFVSKLEKVFYETGGDIPLSWYVNYAEDIDLFAGVGGEPLRELYRMTLEQEKLRGFEGRHADQAARREAYDAGKLAEFQEETRSIIFGMTTPKGVKEMGQEFGGIVDREVGQIQNVLALPEVKTVTGAVAKAWGWTVNAFRIADAWIGEQAWIDPGANVTQGIADATLAAADVVGADDIAHGMLGVTADTLAELTERGAGNRWQARLLAESKIKEDLGMSLEDFTVQAGFGDAMDYVRQMPELDPKVWELWMRAAGGDEDLATDMAVDEILFSSENQEAMKEQQDFYNEQSRVVLQEMEDVDFSNAEAIMSIAASYGELLETIATGVTLAVVNLIEGDSWIFDPEYWQELKNYETPAHVLGLEGTLIGLGVTYGMTMAMDAPLFATRAPLSAAGRWGSQNAADAYHLAYKSVAEISKHDEVLMLGGRSAGGSLGGSIAMDVLEQTGTIEKMANAILGEARDLPTYVMHFSKPQLANAYNHISMAAFAPFADDVAKVTDEAIEAAGARIAKRGMEPLEITVNPSSARQTLSENHLAELAFLQREGHKLVPSTVRLDVKTGLTPSRRLTGFADEEADVIYKIAEGKVLKRNPEAVTVKGADKVEADELLGTRLPRILDDAETVQTPAATVTVKEGGTDVTYQLKRTELELGGVAYSVRTSEGKVVAGVIGRAGKSLEGDLAMATTLGRGSMEQIWDVARIQFDDHFILQSGNSSSMSSQAARFSEKYAKKLIDDKVNDAVRFNADEAMPPAQWADGVTADSVGAVDVDGAIHVQPRRIMPDDLTYGEMDREYIADLFHGHYLDGGDALSANQTTLAVMASRQFGEIMRMQPSKAVQHTRHLFNQINANTLFNYHGPTGTQHISQAGTRMFAAVDDLDGVVVYKRRIMQFHADRGRLQSEAADLALEMRTLDNQQGILRRTYGVDSIVDDGAATAGVKLTFEETGTIKGARELYVKNRKRMDAIKVEMKTNQTQGMDFGELTSILKDMWDDFNRTHIATHPEWKKIPGAIDPDTGLVRYELLMSRQTKQATEYEAILARAHKEGISLEDAAKKEVGVVPQSIIATSGVIDDTLGITVDDFLRQTHDVLKHKSSWLAPASPLEMMTAATGGPDALKRVVAKIATDNIAEVVHNLHLAWVLDKVFTPRTGIVVSMDELISYLHAGGGRTIFTFMEDQVSKKLIRLARLKKSGSWAKMPARTQRRLTELEEYPIYLQQQERAWLETQGVGLDEVTFKKNKFGGNDDYYNAAQRQAQGFMSNEGFVAHLKGAEAFDDWFMLEQTAASARDLQFFDVVTGKVRTGATAEQVRSGYEAMWQLATAELDDAATAAAKKVWLEGAETAAVKGSTKAGPTVLPPWVLEGFGSVTASQQASSGVAGAVDVATNALFTRPLNYRRGAMASTVRKSETARLEKLFASQGRKIMDENEVFDILRRQYPNSPEEMVRAAVPQFQAHLKETQGVVSRRYVQELAEQKVVFEIERRMYSFTNESLAGRKVVGLAPFGKPYADMIGRWTRELFSRPQLRGWLNESNVPGVSKAANAMVDALPINPRTGGFLSRVANTDFDLDRIQEDPAVGWAAQAVGLERIDVGRGLFLFQQGQSPINVLLPGLGVIPVMALEAIFRFNMPDPIKDPLAHQRYMDDWSEWVPSLGFQTPQGIGNRAAAMLLGGGTLSRSVSMGSSMAQLVTGEQFGSTIMKQSWGPRIEATKNIKEALSDPNFYAELADLDGVSAELGMTALIDEEIGKILEGAARAEAVASLKEDFVELMRPVGAVFDSANDDLGEVWLGSMETMGIELPPYMSTDTPEQARRAADWVRNYYFDLPDWERDLAVATNPAMAVNLVSSWKWSDAGLEAQIPGNDLAYRTGGSKTDQARHNAYKDNGWIEPMTPRKVASNIIGTVLQAKERAAKAAYTEGVTIANNERWDEMRDADKAWLEAAAESLRADDILPFRTGRELWNNYPDLKRAYDTEFPPEEGESGFTMKVRPWSAQMPTTPEELRQEFSEDGWALLEITPKLERLLPIIGLDYKHDQPSETVMMNEIYKATANMISETSLENPIFAHIDPDFRGWQATRSVGYQSFTSFYGKVLDGEAFSAETRAEHKQSLVWIGEALDRRAAGDPSWRTVRDNAVARFSRMVQDDAFNQVDNVKKWNDAYGKTLGSYDWVPDEPSPLFDEQGNANPNATQVWVRNVADGDTIHVAFNAPGIGGAQQVTSVRLLGWNAQELGQGGEAERDNLEAAISSAIDRGLPIAIVRDPERYGHTDMYGRVFGWLYIGEDVWYNPDTMIPRKN